jgi:5-methylcytosine-specific restriction endonuclease McrA
MANIRICSKCGKVGLDQYDFRIGWNNIGNKYYYRTECIECGSKYDSQYLKKYPEKKSEKDKRYRKKHPEKVKEQKRRWWKNNPYKIKEKGRKRRVLKHDAEGTHTITDLKYIYDHQKGICGKCGKYIPFDKMTVDHIIPLSWGGSNYASNIQLLCFSCNSSKGNHHATDYRNYVPLFLDLF